MAVCARLLGSKRKSECCEVNTAGITPDFQEELEK